MRGRAMLVDHFMKTTAALRAVADIEGRGDDQNRARIRPGLAHGGQDIGEAWAGDGEAHAGLAGGAGIAVGHEAGALLVAHQHMLDAGARQCAIHLDIMDAGNAEDRVDAIGFEKTDQGLSG